MSFGISWTDESFVTFNENIEYLSQEWDLTTINNFLGRVDEILEAISELILLLFRTLIKTLKI